MFASTAGWHLRLLYFTHVLAKSTLMNPFVATENRLRRDSRKQSVNSKEENNLLRRSDNLLGLCFSSKLQSHAIIHSLFMQAG